LIISDGNLNLLKLYDFKSKIKKLENIKIRTVAVGPDANLDNLKKLSTNNSFYFAEDIQASIKSFMFFDNIKNEVPLNANGII
jgi:hypothetical protein